MPFTLLCYHYDTIRDFINWYIGGAFYSWSKCKRDSIIAHLRHLCETLAINRNDSIESFRISEILLTLDESNNP